MEGFSIFSSPILLLSRRNLLILRSLDLGTFVAWAISRKESFPSLRRRRAIFRLLALSRHFCSTIFRLLICLRIDCGILTCLDSHLRATEGSHEQILDDEDVYIMQLRRSFGFPGTRLYSFCVFEHILLIFNTCSYYLGQEHEKNPVESPPAAITWSVSSIAEGEG